VKLEVLFREMTQMCLWCVHPASEPEIFELTVSGETPLLVLYSRIAYQTDCSPLART
jgi:hypothetical protein